MAGFILSFGIAGVFPNQKEGVVIAKHNLYILTMECFNIFILKFSLDNFI
jgi:hypothetical protein